MDGSTYQALHAVSERYRQLQRLYHSMLVRGKAFGPKFLLQFRSAPFEGNRSREDERCRLQIVAHLLPVDLNSIKATTIAKKEKGDEASQNGGGRGGGGGEGGSSLGELRRRCSEVSNCQKFLPSAPPPPPAESNFKYCTVHNDQCALILVYTLSTTNSPQAHYFTCYASNPKAE